MTKMFFKSALFLRFFLEKLLLTLRTREILAARTEASADFVADVLAPYATPRAPRDE